MVEPTISVDASSYVTANNTTSCPTSTDDKEAAASVPSLDRSSNFLGAPEPSKAQCSLTGTSSAKLKPAGTSSAKMNVPGTSAANTSVSGASENGFSEQVVGSSSAAVQSSRRLSAKCLTVQIIDSGTSLSSNMASGSKLDSSKKETSKVSKVNLSCCFFPRKMSQFPFALSTLKSLNLFQKRTQPEPNITAKKIALQNIDKPTEELATQNWKSFNKSLTEYNITYKMRRAKG